MPFFNINRNCAVSRRTFLRGAGAALALPWLDAMLPAGHAAAPEAPRRMVVVYNDMSFMPKFFFPTGTGRDYPLSPYLEILKDFRQDFTVFSGTSHPNVDGGHDADICFLTAAPHPGRSGFRNAISLDQFAAERIGVKTRFPHLNLLIGTEQRQSLSWTSSGVRIPPEFQPSLVYRRMFMQGNPKEIAEQIEKFRQGRSILDSVADRAKALDKQIGPRDRQRLDQYFTAVREYEQRLRLAEEWERKPKPKVASPLPTDIKDANDLIGRSMLMYDLIRLALQTDSTRLVTLMIADGGTTLKSHGVNEGHHNLTHHGNRPEAVSQLRKVEEAQLKAFAKFLGDLRKTGEKGESLLDRTMVLQGAGMGNANSHNNQNLPVLLAGGGFKHGQHLVFDQRDNYPLPNLFVTMLQRLGIEADKFASSRGTMSGLEMI